MALVDLALPDSALVPDSALSDLAWADLAWVPDSALSDLALTSNWSWADLALPDSALGPDSALSDLAWADLAWADLGLVPFGGLAGIILPNSSLGRTLEGVMAPGWPLLRLGAG